MYLLACERKTQKCIENTNSELSQNYTDKHYYLFIACFDCKIGVFQQAGFIIMLNFGLSMGCLLLLVRLDKRNLRSFKKKLITAQFKALNERISE